MGCVMANVSEKKKKLLYLLQILFEQTDENHALSLSQILAQLEERGISSERKSIYDDFETLRSFGVKIETRKTKSFQYYVKERVFSVEDLRLIVAAISAAPFISEQQTERLASALGKLCSCHQRQRLSEKTDIDE